VASTHAEGDQVPRDDPGIPDTETVYRWLSKQAGFVVQDRVTGERRVSSGAFAPDDDGLSVYRHLLLEREGLTPVEGLARDTGNVIVSLNVGELRSLELGIHDDLNPPGVRDPEHPRHKAHALVVGWEGMTRGKRIKRQRELSRLPSVTIIYG
jgi:hypothetical protein